jgi:hypothetical protein
MLEMVYLIYPLQRKQIYSLPKQDMVCSIIGHIRFRTTNCYTDLVTYCEKEQVPFTPFRTFAEILQTVKSIVSGAVSVGDVVANDVVS